MGAKLPHDELAERCLLGAMLVEPAMVPTVTNMVGSADYYLPKHQWIHQAIIDCFAEGDSDPVAVNKLLEDRGLSRKAGGAPYLFDLMQTVPFAQNAKTYAATVVDRSRLRKLAEIGVRLQNLAATEGYDSDALIAEGHRFFREVEFHDSGEASDFAELVESWQSWDGDPHDVVPTPWPTVNDWLNGGLARGRLVTIGGRPSVGKSLGGLNIAAFAAESGHPAVFFSLEMAKPEVMARILAAGGSADLGELLRRRMSEHNMGRVREYVERHALMPLWVDDRERVTVEQIAARCRSIPRLDVAVIDYLQLVTASDSRVSREQQVAHISRSLKILARELNIAVVVAAQLNRGPVREGKPREPTIADLRESGAVEQDSDQVLLLHREPGDEGFVRMICGKNRVGRTGVVEMKFEGKYARLSPLTEEDECLREIGY